MRAKNKHARLYIINQSEQATAKATTNCTTCIELFSALIFKCLVFCFLFVSVCLLYICKQCTIS